MLNVLKLVSSQCIVVYRFGIEVVYTQCPVATIHVWGLHLPEPLLDALSYNEATPILQLAGIVTSIMTMAMTIAKVNMKIIIIIAKTIAGFIDMLNIEPLHLQNILLVVHSVT